MVNVTVTYKMFPTYASGLRKLGNKLNTHFTSAYTKVDDMRKDWYGIRYNTLVASFNKLAPTINEMLKLIITNTPYSLEKIAKNYASFDGGKKVEPSKTPIKAMKKIKDSKVDNMAINDVNVKKTKEAVEKDFEAARKVMGELQDAIKKIQWTGSAATSFRTNFNKNKSTIETEIKKINTQFGSLMTKTINEAKKTENANMGIK